MRRVPTRRSYSELTADLKRIPLRQSSEVAYVSIQISAESRSPPTSREAAYQTPNKCPEWARTDRSSHRAATHPAEPSTTPTPNLACKLFVERFHRLGRLALLGRRVQAVVSIVYTI